MIFDRTEENPGARFLFIAACMVVVVYGLRLARPILLPFFLALFLSVLSLPILIWLRRRMPAPLAVFFTMLINVAGLILMLLLGTQSVGQLQDRLPVYLRRFQVVRDSWIQWLEDRGIPGRQYLSLDLIDPAAWLDFAAGSVTRLATLVSALVLVLLVMYFMLSEATVFPQKFRAIFRQPTLGSGRAGKFVQEVQAYLRIKSLVSLATGVLLGLWCWFMDVDFPLLLGLLAFVLNYVPTIGSAIASIPAIFLALIQVSPAHAILVAVGYLGVNLVFGNIVEPNLMGRRLGLSTLVVLLSLLFWGWLWGPLGALLSVPLTMVVRIWLENTEDLRWMAVILSKNAPEAVVVPPLEMPPPIARSRAASSPSAEVEPGPDPEGSREEEQAHAPHPL